jgi:hypothetical protein
VPSPEPESPRSNFLARPRQPAVLISMAAHRWRALQLPEVSIRAISL